MALVTSYGTQGTELGLLMTERTYRRDGTKSGVIWCHGRGADGTNALDQPTVGPILAAIINTLGLPIVSMSMGGALTWGSDTAVNAPMTNALAQLTALGAKTAGYVLMGSSMGTLTGLGSILKGTLLASKVACAVLFDAIPDLASFHDANRGGWATEIESAYGGAAAYAAGVAAHDPAQHPSAFTGFPIQLYNGTADTLAPNADAQSFAAAVGSNVSAVQVAGGTHSTTPALVDPAAIVSFVRAYV